MWSETGTEDQHPCYLSMCIVCVYIICVHICVYKYIYRHTHMHRQSNSSGVALAPIETEGHHHFLALLV